LYFYYIFFTKREIKRLLYIICRVIKLKLFTNKNVGNENFGIGWGLSDGVSEGFRDEERKSFCFHFKGKKEKKKRRTKKKKKK